MRKQEKVEIIYITISIHRRIKLSTFPKNTSLEIIFYEKFILFLKNIIRINILMNFAIANFAIIWINNHFTNVEVYAFAVLEEKRRRPNSHVVATQRRHFVRNIRRGRRAVSRIKQKQNELMIQWRERRRLKCRKWYCTVWEALTTTFSR